MIWHGMGHRGKLVAYAPDFSRNSARRSIPFSEPRSSSMFSSLSSLSRRWWCMSCSVHS